jgi:uncharacterized SAM-binding protein YcdF (DUF218 family)
MIGRDDSAAGAGRGRFAGVVAGSRLRPWTRAMLRYLVGAIVVAGLVTVGVAVRIVQVGLTDEREPADAIVVLGAAQYNGTPSPVYQARLDHAAQLFRAGVAGQILTIGGGQTGDTTTEGQAGRQALIDAGIPAGSVTAVGVGNDTLVSLRAAALVLDRNNWTSIVLVTDPWHAHRSQLIARDLGLAAQVSPVDQGPATRRSVIPAYVLRETAGTLFYLVVGGPSGAGSPVL